jgi:hypothetical protein
VDVINKLTDIMVQSNELLLYSRFYYIFIRANSSAPIDLNGVTCLPEKEEMLEVLSAGAKNLAESMAFAYKHTKNNNEFEMWED